MSNSHSWRTLGHAWPRSPRASTGLLLQCRLQSRGLGPRGPGGRDGGGEKERKAVVRTVPDLLPLPKPNRVTRPHFGRKFEILYGSEIGHIGGLGGPGGLGGHFAGPGGFAPTFLKGLRGTRGLPEPQNDQFPTLKKLRNFMDPQSAATQSLHLALVADRSPYDTGRDPRAGPPPKESCAKEGAAGVL